MRRLKLLGRDAIYHCISRTVNGERLFENGDKEILRSMIHQVADFSGVEVLTYCIMSNHFHVLVRVRGAQLVSDRELMRRYRVLYPEPNHYQAASANIMEAELQVGGDEAAAIRRKLLARMSDISEFMKAVKQRFSVWYNRSHQRFGTLWAERFKSLLVEGAGSPLQTVAAYIDLNPVRAGIVEDPKDYRFCGYAEAVAGEQMACSGLRSVWADYIGESETTRALAIRSALKAHRMLIFGAGASPWTHRGHVIDRQEALKVLEAQQGQLPKAVLLRCRVRYFTDGAILGSAEFVRGFTQARQLTDGRKYPPKVNALRGAGWGDLSVIRGLRRRVFA
jgi:putative transposase